MENNERFWNAGSGLFWGLGPLGMPPNGLGYTYPNMMPFWSFGTEPNLWANVNNQNEMMNKINREHIQGQVMPIEMMYPKCSKMMYDLVMKECNMFIRNNGGMMPNKICKEELCKMVDNCNNNIMKDEDIFMDTLKSDWACKRSVELDNEESDQNEETRYGMGTFGNLIVGNMLGILLIQELRRRGCLYCY